MIWWSAVLIIVYLVVKRSVNRQETKEIREGQTSTPARRAAARHSDTNGL